MKAEERHELKQNDLASWLQYGLPMFLKQNGSYVLLVIALGFLGFQLYNLYERKQAVARENAWQELSQAPMAESPPARWQGIIDTYDYPDLKVQAYLDMATFYTRIVLFPEQMNTLKITKNEALTKAYDAYKHARDLMPNDSLIVAKGTLGVAAVDEDRGDWDAAKKEYQSIIDGKLFADTPFVELARDRLATIDQRKDAPRLAAMIPTAPASQPGISLPGGLGQPLPEFNLPSLTTPSGPPLPGGMSLPAFPVESPTTAPASTQPK